MRNKNLSQNPNKGFLDELAGDQLAANTPKVAKTKKPFTWDKPVSGGEARPVSANVPRRLNEQSKVGRPKSNITIEAKQLSEKFKK